MAARGVRDGACDAHASRAAGGGTAASGSSGAPRRNERKSEPSGGGGFRLLSALDAIELNEELCTCNAVVCAERMKHTATLRECLLDGEYE